MTKRIFLYTDGGSRGNPGPSAIGGLAFDVTGIEAYYEKPADVPRDRKVFEFSEMLLGHCTNNEAEYRALIRGLVLAREHGATRVDCFMDSQLVVRQMQGAWKINSQTMSAFANEVVGLAALFHRVTYNWIGRTFNRDADRLVNDALNKAKVQQTRDSHTHPHS